MYLVFDENICVHHLNVQKKEKNILHTDKIKLKSFD